MARPQKKGLDYFPFDVDFFADQKIKILKSRFGTDGLAIYVYLLCEIYKNNGYYINYDEDYQFIIQDDLNLNENVVEQIMEFLFNRSLLEKILVKSDTFITSKAIQRRFQEAIKLRKKPVVVNPNLWLLSDEETLGCIKVNIYQGLSEINTDKSEINTIKESKVKKRKEKQSKDFVSSAALQTLDTSEYFIALILNTGDFYLVRHNEVDEYRSLYPAVDVEQELRSMCGWLKANPKNRKTKNGIERFINSWLKKTQDRGGVGYGKRRSVSANNRPTSEPGTTTGYQTKNVY